MTLTARTLQLPEEQPLRGVANYHWYLHDDAPGVVLLKVIEHRAYINGSMATRIELEEAADGLWWVTTASKDTYLLAEYDLTQSF